ncbi:hypothetical protein [Paracoccus sp. JM45]|uniref:hypothetical protein n=1 Tax=Paracoccus sp. JM45 TaxID=2283626 RepID=UPI002104B214|nr:hypothetical protein [Paracoccus sp. JM45]
MSALVQSIVRCKMIVHPELETSIEDRLKAGWSPEQIAGRMGLERHPILVSHETIYQFAYSKDGRAEEFYWHFPDNRKRRRLLGYRHHQSGHIFDTQSLSHRPDRIAERAGFKQLNVAEQDHGSEGREYELSSAEPIHWHRCLARLVRHLLLAE